MKPSATRVAYRYLMAYGYGSGWGNDQWNKAVKAFDKVLKQAFQKQGFTLRYVGGTDDYDNNTGYYRRMIRQYVFSSDTEDDRLHIDFPRWGRCKWEWKNLRKKGTFNFKVGTDPDRLAQRVARAIIKALPPPEPEGQKGVSDAAIQRGLERLEWDRGEAGGEFREVRALSGGNGWGGEPYRRQRHDHYGNDGDGWGEEWYDEYAYPLKRAVQKALNKTFGRNVLEVTEIGEKGHVYIYRVK